MPATCDNDENFTLSSRHHVLTSFLELIAPSRCAICSNWLTVGEDTLCNRCHKLAEPHLDLCPSTGMKRLSVFSYVAEIRSAILGMKFGGEDWRGVALGRSTQRHLASSFADENHVLVPIPLHHRRLATRGYNQSERIARGIRSQSTYGIASALLSRPSYESARAQASAGERRARTNPFTVNKNARAGARAQSVILVDDVLTTGTTLAHAHDRLASEGIRVAGALVLTRTPAPLTDGS